MMGLGNRTVGDARAPSILDGGMRRGIWYSDLGRRRVRQEQ